MFSIVKEFIYFISFVVRIAQLHLSLLHSQLSYNGVLLKTTLQLCKYNFHKAAEVFGQLNETNEVFLAMLQHLELEEFLADRMLINILQYYYYLFKFLIFFFLFIPRATFIAMEILLDPFYTLRFQSNKQ